METIKETLPVLRGVEHFGGPTLSTAEAIRTNVKDYRERRISYADFSDAVGELWKEAVRMDMAEDVTLALLETK